MTAAEPSPLVGSDLPEGWAFDVLESLGQWSTGGTPSRKIPTYFGAGYPWIKSGDLNDGVVLRTEETISKSGLANSAAKLLPPGTVTIALYGATIGKLAILGMEAATNQACASCRVDASISTNSFVFYYLLQQRPALIAAGQGGAQPNLTNQIVRSWPIALPPVAEQKRIVNKVERLLACVNAARERLAHAPGIVKRFRQAVLAAACSGRLTADWRDEGQRVGSAESELEECRAITAKNLHRKKKRKRGTIGLADVEVPEALPESWAVRQVKDLVEIGAIVDFQDGNHGDLYPRRTDFGETGLIFITATQVLNNEVRLSEAPRLSISKASQLRIGRAHGRDVLLTHNATVGRVAILPADCGEVILGTSVTYYRFKADTIDPLYGCFAMQGPFWQAQLRAVMEQTTRNQVSVMKQAEFWLVTPPINEQHEIVRRVEALFKLADAIDKRVAAATARAEKLTQAILAKAFRGELVPTEAELARREGRSYEPASALLARIGTERRVVSGINRGANKTSTEEKDAGI